jgi:type IV pilus secretin PilQ/predicted competence protein
MARRIARAALVLQCCLVGAAGAPAEEAVPVAEELLAEESAEAAFEPARVSMTFEEADLRSVLKSFSQQSGINVIAATEISKQPVTVFLEDVTVLDAFDQILKAGRLTYERPAGSDIYIVKPLEEAAQAAVGTLTRVYRLKYARVSQSVLAKAAAIFGNRTPFEAGLGAATSSGGASAGDVGIDAVIKNLLTPAGQVVVDGRTNRLMITDVPENFPRLETALAALDVRTSQVMVDAEIIETSLNKLKDLGVEWGTGSEGTLFQLTPAKRESRFPFSQWFGDQGRDDLLSGSTAIADPRMTVGTMDASQAVMVLQALETDTDAKILARPKVLTLDNESAVIRLVTDETIGFETTTGETSGTTTSEPERTTTGIVLVVTPQVNEDGYVTMIIEPSVSKTVASKITPPSGQATTRDPKTRSSRTMVRVRSGDTLVVGGLIDRDEQESLRRVPVLSGIPFLGEAFKNTEITNNASELIVFVTPQILGGESETQLASSGQAALTGAREQRPGSSRQDLMEQTLNRLERPAL